LFKYTDEGQFNGINEKGGTKMTGVKRQWVWVGLVLLISMFFVAGSSALAAEKGPIKVGIMLPYTGVNALAAKLTNDGVELYFNEIGLKAGGRAIQLIKEDTELNPTVGLTKVRRLIEQHKVDFVIGPLSSAVGLAIHDYVRKQKVVQVNPVATTRELTSPEKASENIFRVCDTSDQTNFTMAKWVFKNSPYRSFVLSSADWAAGHHSMDAFKAGFEEAGGKIIKEVYPKMGTMDFAPFLSVIDAKGADAVYTFYTGTDAVRFVQQYQEFGLKKKLPLYGHNVLTDDPYLASIGDSALGIMSVAHYSAALDTPRNRAFVKAHISKYGEPPSRYAEFGYTAANVVGAAIQAVKGEIEDPPRVAKEIMNIAPKIETPAGPLAFDKYHQRILAMYILKVEKRDGKLVNAVIDRTPPVPQSDVWKYWQQK
jgi:branched-chain amino acid transport system substrate-binding protein